MNTNAIPVNINNILFVVKKPNKENQAFPNDMHAFIRNSKQKSHVHV